MLAGEAGKLKAVGTAFAEGVPTEAEIRAAGFSPEDYEDDYVECWPDNWPAFRLFADLSTQWRTAMTSFIGLDYSVLFHRMDRMHLSQDDYDDLFADIRTLEGAALVVLNRKPDDA